MHPQIFGIIKGYGVLLALSFLLGIYFSIRRGRSRAMNDEVVSDLCFGVLLSSIIGVRLFYVMTHLSDFHPWYKVFYIWEGGLTLYGGIIAAIITVFYLSRKRGLQFLVVADVMAPQVLLGVGFTRLGCLLNGCCFGMPTDLPWGVHFPDACAAGYAAAGQALHPTQVYSSMLAFLGWGLLLYLDKKPFITGITFARFLIFYGASRFIVDNYRWYENSAIHFGDITTSQLISIALISIGAVIMIVARRKNA
jgi:phosphatidylglycerol---prolipoprotein diacylglyceryl transferase